MKGYVSMKKIGFIGAGNMGYAIIKGVLGSEVSKYSKILAYDMNQAALDRLSQLDVEICSNESELVEKSDYIFLAIKPQQLETALENAAGAFESSKVIISICAGITAEYIQSKTVSDAKVVLVMPNTPLLLGEGASALSKNDNVSDEEFEFVKGIFSSCGIATVIPQNKMKEIIAINGSSPAFIYLYAKYFIDYGIKEGIDEQACKELFAESLIGSAKVIIDSGYSLDELIKMVSSPGGTTLAGLEKLREGKLDETVENCCKACTSRAYELSK